jgi:GntR family transcriptional regulator
MPEQVSEHRFRVNPDSPMPLYYQIQENLRELIRGQEIPKGESLPSERELSDLYGVNRLTVRQAIAELVNEGVLVRKRGIGTFVAEQKVIQAMPGLRGFTERMLRAGYQPGSRIISLTRGLPTRSAAQALQIAPEIEVVNLVRLRTINDEPMMLETSVLVASRVPDLTLEQIAHQSLYQLLTTRYQIQIVEADEVLEPVALTSYEAHLLGAEVGRPAMLVEGTIYSLNRVPIEFTKSLVRGDKARFYFRLHRTGELDPMG